MIAAVLVLTALFCVWLMLLGAPLLVAFVAGFATGALASR